MKHRRHIRHPVLAAAWPVLAMRPVAAQEAEDPLVQGARIGVQAYSSASEAYAAGFMMPSVALWSLAIAAGVVLLEWLLARPRR